MNIQATLAFLENAEFTPYRHKSHYEEQIEQERKNLPVYDCEILFIGDETLNAVEEGSYTFLTVSQAKQKYPELYKQSGGFASSSAQPSDAVEQVAIDAQFLIESLETIDPICLGRNCQKCIDFNYCFNCDRLSHWSRAQGLQS